MILKGFEKIFCCSLCGKSSSIFLIDSPISSLCKECYEKKDEVKIKIKEVFDSEKLLP